MSKGPRAPTLHNVASGEPGVAAPTVGSAPWALAVIAGTLRHLEAASLVLWSEQAGFCCLWSGLEARVSGVERRGPIVARRVNAQFPTADGLNPCDRFDQVSWRAMLDGQPPGNSPRRSGLLQDVDEASDGGRHGHDGDDNDK